MRFHVGVAFLPTEELLPLAAAAEELGYHGVYVSDHLIYPRELRSKYTYTEDGSPIWTPEADWPDPWVLISAMAARTERLVFTTGVYIAPARDLLTVAKAVGTAAVLSGNRVRLGVGVGWCEEEFALTGQSFRDRGRRLDDMIPALRALWAGGWVEYHGTHYDVPACTMNPSPSQPVPIYGGGHSDPALRRTAALCDGWLAASAYTPDEAWHHLGRLAAARRAAGREHEPFDIYLGLRARPDVDLYRRLEEAGVTDLLCAPWFGGATAGDRRDALARFADEVVAKMR